MQLLTGRPSEFKEVLHLVFVWMTAKKPLLRKTSSRIEPVPVPNVGRNDSVAEHVATTGARVYAGFEQLTDLPNFPQYLPPKKEVIEVPIEAVEAEVEEGPCCVYVVDDVPQYIHNSVNRYRYMDSPEGWRLRKSGRMGEYDLVKKGGSGKTCVVTYKPGWRTVGVGSPYIPSDRYKWVFENEQTALSVDESHKVHHMQTLMTLNGSAVFRNSSSL